jgi:hypothetical protein
MLGTKETIEQLTNPPVKHTRGGIWYQHKGGRPRVVSKETLKMLEAAFNMGCKDAEAALFAGIAYSTLKNYQTEHPEFLEQKESWKQSPTLKARKMVVDNLDKNLTNAQWFLQRKAPDEFAEKQEIGFTSKVLIMDKEDLETLPAGEVKLIEQ